MEGLIFGILRYFSCRRLQRYYGLILPWFEKIHLSIFRWVFFVFFLKYVYFESYISSVKRV